MKLKREEDMYEIIGEYFEKECYETIIDKPARSGIKFDLLKGWYVDVAGIKRDKNPQELIAVEAKNNLGAQSVVQAISQAEMYRSAFNKVYVAFPESDFDSKENEKVKNEITELCDAKGIGILNVGKVCKEILPATPSYLKIDIYHNVINQFEPGEFEGFEKEDYARFYSNDAYLVWNKFTLFMEEMKDRLKSKEVILTHEPTWNGWFFSFSDVSAENKSYFKVPHFTVNWDDGVLLQLIVREPSYLNALKKKVKNNQSDLYNLLKKLGKGDYSFKIKIEERTHLGGYRTDSTSEYVFYSKYISKDIYQEFVDFLLKKRKGKIWLRSTYFVSLDEEICHSKNLIDDLAGAVSDLMPLYQYFMNKEKD